MGSVSILRVSRRAASSPMKYKFCTCHNFYFSGGTVLVPSNEELVADKDGTGWPTCDRPLKGACQAYYDRYPVADDYESLYATRTFISSCRRRVRLIKGSHRRTWPFIK